MESKPKPLLRNSAIYLAATILEAGIPFILLPIITSYLEPADYGRIALFFIACSFSQLFIGLNQENSITANFYHLKNDQLKSYISSVVVAALACFLAVTGFTYLFSEVLSNWLEVSHWWVLGIPLTGLTMFLRSIFLTILRLEERPISYGCYSIIGTLLNLCISLYCVAILKLSWQGRLIGFCTAFFASGLFAFFFLWSKNMLQWTFNRAMIKDSFRISVPLIPHSLSGYMNTSIDRFFISGMVGMSAAGIYTAGYQISQGLNLLVGAFNQAWAPYLMKQLAHHENESTKIQLLRITYIYIVIVISLALVISFGVWTFGIWLLPVKFHGSFPYVFWLTLAFASNGMYYMVVNYLFHCKKTTILPKITFGCTLLNVAMNYALIKVNGAIGAAQATFLVNLLNFIFVTIAVQKLYPLPWGKAFKLRDHGHTTNI
jgi:O-antigen/teichoic acid export membrane protein